MRPHCRYGVIKCKNSCNAATMVIANMFLKMTAAEIDDRTFLPQEKNNKTAARVSRGVRDR